MSLEKDLQRLQDAGVLDETVAGRIREFYRKQEVGRPNIVLLTSSILAALLVGLGIILIIANNWDMLEKSWRVALAFTPLVLAQGLCWYVLLKRKDSPVWREVAAVLLFCAVGASMVLVAQIYMISGEEADFVLTWAALSVPVIYLLRSSVVSLFCIVMSAQYVSIAGFQFKQHHLPWEGVVLLLSLLPWFFMLYRESRIKESVAMYFHNWFLAVALVVYAGAMVEDDRPAMLLVYLCLFGLFFQIGEKWFSGLSRTWGNSFSLLGSGGMFVLMLFSGFRFFWREMQEGKWVPAKHMLSAEGVICLVMIAVAAAIWYNRRKESGGWLKQPENVVWVMPFLLYQVGFNALLCQWLINLMVLLSGILILRDGEERNSLGRMNFGLAVISFLILTRFFDAELPYVWRGVIFLAVGICFFVVNYWYFSKHRKNDAA